jgi:ABC-2 type transport system permease protein
VSFATSLRIFFVGGLTSYRALFGWLSPSILLTTLFATPIFQILLFAYIGRAAGLENDRFYLIGNAIQYVSIPCVFGMVQLIAGERYSQTLAFVLVTPAGRLPLFLGRAFPVVVNGAVVSIVSFAVASLLLDVRVPMSSLPPLLVVVVVASFACTGFGLILAGIGLRVRETSVMNNIVFGLLLIFTGSNVRLDRLPGWMQAVGESMPLTHAIEAGRRLADGATLGDVSGLLAREAGLGVVYVVAGYAFLVFMETQSRKHSTLELS